PGLQDRGFFFGSTNGDAVPTDDDFRPIGTSMQRSASREAINGIAHSDEWVGVSTRADLNFWHARGKADPVAIPQGGHQIAKTASGLFLAPIGRNGFLAASPPFVDGGEAKGYNSDRPGFYGYRLATFVAPETGEIVACASRDGTILASQLQGNAP